MLCSLHLDGVWMLSGILEGLIEVQLCHNMPYNSGRGSPIVGYILTIFFLEYSDYVSQRHKFGLHNSLFNFASSRLVRLVFMWGISTNSSLALCLRLFPLLFSD